MKSVARFSTTCRKISSPNQSTPGVKKVTAKNLKKAMLKRCEIKMGNQGLLLMMELNFLIMMTRALNITVACQLRSYSGRQQ